MLQRGGTEPGSLLWPPAKGPLRLGGGKPGDPVSGQVLPTLPRALRVHSSIGSAQATNQNGLFGFTA